MKKAIKFLKWAGIFLALLVAGLAIFVLANQNRTFDAPYPQIFASKDSAIIGRGKYLFYGPAHCLDCHSAVEDLEKVEQGIHVIPKGGRTWHMPIGVLKSPNITPDPETGIGNLSDPEIARSLRFGVNSKGRALFDMMPFHETSDEDLQALISYLRTLPVVKHEVKTFEPNLLGMVLNALVFKPVGPSHEVPKSVSKDAGIAYGEYLATSIANCKGCHTDRDLKTGAYVGPEYAGGFHMPIDGKEGEFVVTPNLTPDPETGRITTWTEERFIHRFRQGKSIKDSHMPWGPFKQFSDNDLRSIYAFLKTLKPIKNDTGETLVKKG